MPNIQKSIGFAAPLARDRFLQFGGNLRGRVVRTCHHHGGGIRYSAEGLVRAKGRDRNLRHRDRVNRTPQLHLGRVHHVSATPLAVLEIRRGAFALPFNGLSPSTTLSTTRLLASTAPCANLQAPSLLTTLSSFAATANVRALGSPAAHHHQTPPTHGRNPPGRLVTQALAHALLLGLVVADGPLPHARMVGLVVADGPLPHARMVGLVVADGHLPHARMVGLVVADEPLPHARMVGLVVADGSQPHARMVGLVVVDGSLPHARMVG